MIGRSCDHDITLNLPINNEKLINLGNPGLLLMPA